MNLVSYLEKTYGYDTPIFLKDVRIGGKSKAAIKQEFYRAVKNNKVEREANGVYYLKSDKEFGGIITFEKIISKKYLYTENIIPSFEDLFVEGYYSGLTFLNRIGVSQQVPAIIEITTNKTSSKKRFFTMSGRVAIIRKARTTITFQNWKMLQFLDMFYFLEMHEVIDNKELLKKYIKDNSLSKNQFTQYIGLYGMNTLKKIMEGGLVDAFV